MLIKESVSKQSWTEEEKNICFHQVMPLVEMISDIH